MNFFSHRIVPFLLLFGLYFSSTAQTNIDKYRIETKFHYGYIIPHRPFMAILNEKHTIAYELSYAKRLHQTGTWEENYKFPEFGYSIMMFQLGNKRMLGNAVGVSWFFNFPFRITKGLEYSLKVGQGLGWIQKKFDRESNFKNAANSTDLNGFVHLNNTLSIAITPNFRTSLGMAFSHFSNGSFKKPNLGLNIPTLNVGFTYGIDKVTLNHSKEPIKYSKGFDYFITIGGARKEIRPILGDKYSVVALNLSTEKFVSKKSKLGLGFDIFHDTSIKERLKRKDKENTGFVDITKLGVHFSYLLNVGNVTYLFQPGIYLRSSYKGDGDLYHRVGTRYSLTKRLRLNMTLKTHFAVADHIEVGLTYKLNK